MRQRWQVMGHIQITLALVGLATYFMDFHELVRDEYAETTTWVRDSGWDHSRWVVVCLAVYGLCQIWAFAKPRRIGPSTIALIAIVLAIVFMMSASLFPHFLSRSHSLWPEPVCWLALLAAFSLAIASLVGASRRKAEFFAAPPLR
jgi:hypothetical protein